MARAASQLRWWSISLPTARARLASCRGGDTHASTRIELSSARSRHSECAPTLAVTLAPTSERLRRSLETALRAAGPAAAPRTCSSRTRATVALALLHTSVPFALAATRALSSSRHGHISASSANGRCSEGAAESLDDARRSQHLTVYASAAWVAAGEAGGVASPGSAAHMTACAVDADSQSASSAPPVAAREPMVARARCATAREVPWEANPSPCDGDGTLVRIAACIAHHSSTATSVVQAHRPAARRWLQPSSTGTGQGCSTYAPGLLPQAAPSRRTRSATSWTHKLWTTPACCA